MVRFFRFFFLLASFVTPAFSQGRIDCSAMKSHILSDTVRYCVFLPASYDDGVKKRPPARYPVLYFLHGLGSNEQMLFGSGGWNLIQDLRQQKKIGDFLVVTPDARASFYINSADGRVRYSDFFMREFIPYIESAYSVQRERKARAIGGISMGGYGALRFAFAYPETFSAVSAESAALMTESPTELTRSMRSDTSLRTTMGAVFGNPIDARHWEANDPVYLAKKNKAQIANLAIYFNCGRDDDFKFEIGAQALDRQLQAEGIRHEFHLYPGDHSASYFLSHLGEQMQFHWEKFEAGK
jgi:S-formylglutathione hydrolase FrmB